jgi:hypothetical protein
VRLKPTDLLVSLLVSKPILTGRYQQADTNMALTDVAIRALKAGEALQKVSDGGGLQLWVQPNGSKLWRMAFRFNGAQKTLAFGAYPEISLSDGRAPAHNGNAPSSL